ncbi:MAG: ABC-2 family transporter protein [bacterium]|nr:ABC-2 family transporter protein [bacterium]
MKDIIYFIKQSTYNFKNAYALRASFWTGVFGMMLNNIAFFVIWVLFMEATGPIGGWNSMDVVGMLGISLVTFGVTHAFFYGIVDLPQSVVKGSFDQTLLSPVSTFLKISGSSFSVTAFGDLLEGLIIVIVYGIYLGLSFYGWMLLLLGILSGCVIFLCIRLLCSLVVFFVYDGEVVSAQLFDIFLRPGLYPGPIFPEKLKIFFMTIIPTLITSAIPIDILKAHSLKLAGWSIFITLVWVGITYAVFTLAIKRYESGNLLR